MLNAKFIPVTGIAYGCWGIIENDGDESGRVTIFPFSLLELPLSIIEFTLVDTLVYTKISHS